MIRLARFRVKYYTEKVHSIQLKEVIANGTDYQRHDNR